MVIIIVCRDYTRGCRFVNDNDLHYGNCVRIILPPNLEGG